MRVSAAGNMPLQGLVKPPAKPVVMIVCNFGEKRAKKSVSRFEKRGRIWYNIIEIKCADCARAGGRNDSSFGR